MSAGIAAANDQALAAARSWQRRRRLHAVLARVSSSGERNDFEFNRRVDSRK